MGVAAWRAPPLPSALLWLHSAPICEGCFFVGIFCCFWAQAHAVGESGGGVESAEEGDGLVEQPIVGVELAKAQHASQFAVHMPRFQNNAA